MVAELVRTLEREECVRTGGGEGRRERGAARLANSVDENNRSASKGECAPFFRAGAMRRGWANGWRAWQCFDLGGGCVLA